MKVSSLSDPVNRTVTLLSNQALTFDRMLMLFNGVNTMNAKSSTKEFSAYVKNFGYELLSDYVGALKKVKIKCDRGHIINVLPNSIKQGSRCGYCAGHKFEDPNHFAEYVEKFDYKLLSSYINCKTKVSIRCSKGHIYNVMPSNFKSGSRCAICAGQKFENVNHFAEYVEKFGYELLSPYITTHTKVLIRCDRNHKYYVRPADFKKGKRCPECFAANIYTGRTVISVTDRIQRYINTQLKRDESKKTWQDFYTDDQLKEVAAPITDFYLRSRQGHHVDHIIPVSMFDLTDPVQLKACWSLPNLQRLTASENMSKGNRLHPNQLIKIAEDDKLYNIAQVASRMMKYQKIFMKVCRDEYEQSLSVKSNA